MCYTITIWGNIVAQVKHILILVCMLIFIQSIAAEKINETSFQELGAGNFSLTKPGARECFSVNFDKDLNLNSSDYYTVVSFHTAFTPVNQDANISVFLNDNRKDVFTFKGTDVKTGWFRMDLPRELLKKQNQFR